jgi:5'-methylthioadenosine phosphorylase
LFVGRLGDIDVAFLPRHGRKHAIPPHLINYRANLWALRSVGVRQVLGPCAVGSLRVEQGPGTLVVPDQLIDRTYGRARTFYDGTPAEVVHVPFADPYCPDGRKAVLVAAEQSWGESPIDGGTLVVIQGPRFSTRAESRFHTQIGGTIVGMTGSPEADLARELGLCYTSIALVTDLDAGVEEGEGVTHAEVLEAFGRNVGRLRTLLFDVIAALPTERACPCSHTLDGIETGIELP